MLVNHIICFHLYNDYSGSPKVLKMVLEGLLRRGVVIDLFTSHGGVLDELSEKQGIKFHYYPYNFSKNGWVTLVRYVLVQFYTFFLAFRWLFKKNITFYINTLLPVGPALAGKLMGKKVVYHYHENAFAKGRFYKFLAAVMQKLADEIICVSTYQAKFLNRKSKISVIQNALPSEFVAKLVPNISAAFERQRVLMLGSLKLYKSPLEFITLSQKLPQFCFELVINDDKENINQFLAEHHIIVPQNLIIYPRQSDVAKFYNQASLVLNLSNSKMFVETFGLTALEAMSAGLPVIVPTEGGIAELVTDGVNGYKIDVKDLDKISDCICKILKDKKLYIQLSENALSSAERYNAEAMINGIYSLF